MGKKDYQKEHTETLLDNFIIARYSSHGQDFEILIKPDAVEKFRGGRDVDVLENMPVDQIFFDAKKGQKASSSMLDRIFDTKDIETIAREILEEGDVQITTEQRKKRQEQKRKDIVNRIVRESMNPQTEAPHPPSRIENAMKEANVHIDPFRPVSKQIEDVVDEIQSLIPLSFDKLVFKIKIKGDMYGKLYGVLKDIGNITKEEWLNDGNWQARVKVPAGIQDKLYERVNDVTKGKAEIELLD